MLALGLLAIAVSFDGFAVAFSLGSRQIQLSLWCMWTMAVLSGCMTYVAMKSGEFCASVYPAIHFDQLGAWLFVTLGIYMLAGKLISIRRFKQGRGIQLIFFPPRADVKRTRHISFAESIWLGLCLSLDAVGAGIGLAWQGYESWVSSLCIASFGAIFMICGLHLGRKWNQKGSYTFLEVVPGILMIVWGITKFIL